jgi:DNA processing protein
MHQNDLKYWLALKSIEGVGNIGFKNLLDALGTPRNVFHATFHTLTVVPGIGRKTTAHIKDFNDWRTIEDELEHVKKNGAQIITYQDPLYPKSLLNIYDFPVFLYVKGSLKEDDVNIAVVGSRLASTYGKYSTERLCRELVLKGITIVSGLARGIDSSAHRGALTGGGRTIAVLGCGLDIVYPSENEKLFEEIVSHGAVITEFPYGTPPNAPNFPARNRIISGLSLGVVVVEANEKSGSLITARLALEQGREVFAVPGTIDSAGSRGTHKLIKEGAKLIENVYDILDEILPQVEKTGTAVISKGEKGAVPDLSTHFSDSRDKRDEQDTKVFSGLTDNENTVFKALSLQAIDVDGIITATGFTSPEVLNILLTLELRGIIKQLPGKKYIIEE